MKIFRKLIHKPSEKNFQQKNHNRNRAALNYLRELGFFLPEIRKALLDLNGIKLKYMICKKATFGTLSRTNAGSLHNASAQAVIAEKLKLKVDELFPHEYNTEK